MAFVNRGSILQSHTESLNVDEYLVAPNKSSWLVMQGDGNVVLYKGPAETSFARDPTMYATGTNGQGNFGAYYFHLTNDGELVAFSGLHHLTIRNANGAAKRGNNHDGCFIAGLGGCELAVTDDEGIMIRKVKPGGVRGVRPIWFSDNRTWHMRLIIAGLGSEPFTKVAESETDALGDYAMNTRRQLLEQTGHSVTTEIVSVDY